ncbi:MAG: hypothetical protein ACI857_002234 [Arenicella sp.]|jgi:hypothetical protein
MDYKVDNAEISIIGKNFLRTCYREKALLNPLHLEKTRDKYSAILETEDLSELRLMVVFEGEIEISRDIGERYLTERVRPKIGEALVAKSPKTLEYIKAAAAVMSGTHPVEIFTSESDANNWLKNL